MKTSSILAFVFVMFANIACDTKKEKFLSSEDGYRYKYIEKGNGKKPVEGNYFLFNLAYGLSEDSVMYTTDEREEPTGAFCSFENWNQSGKFYKFLRDMKVDDSVVLKIDAKDFFNKTMRSALPESINEEDTLIVRVGAYGVMDPFKYQMESNPNMRSQHEKDIEILNDYFTDNNIDNVQSLENGLNYVIHEEGDGPKPEQGDKVSVHYTGKLMDSTKFDSSVDRGEPFSFNIGKGEVIMGWDKGFIALKEGTKATLYIPSALAYGNRGAGKAIPPNSILIFDVELLEVTKDGNKDS